MKFYQWDLTFTKFGQGAQREIRYSKIHTFMLKAIFIASHGNEYSDRGMIGTRAHYCDSANGSKETES